MSPKQAKAYFEWFTEQIPGRVAILEKAVQSTPEPAYQTWRADFTADSLDVLEQWFAQHLNKVTLTKEQQQAYQQSFPEALRSIVNVPQHGTDRQGHSLMVDVAIYLGETLRLALPQTEWKLQTGSRRNVDFQQPVLTGFGKAVACNPLRLVQVYADKLLEGRKDIAGLRNLFDTWAGYAYSDVG